MFWFKKRSSRPTAEDAARRLVILKHVVGAGLLAPPREMLAEMTAKWQPEEREKFHREAETQRDQLWEGLRGAGLWSHLSPCEQALAKTTMATVNHQQQVDATWRLESVQTLMWALGLLEALPPYDTQAGHDLLKQVPLADLPAFVRSARLRETKVLDEARDLAEFWHWRSRTRQLIERGDPFPDDPKMRAAGFNSYDDIVRFTARKAAEEGMIPPCIDDDFPARGKAYRDLTAEEWSEVGSITSERHFALNWLCGYAPSNRWDDTPTNT